MPWRRPGHRVGMDNYKGCRILHIELVVGIVVYERNRELGRSRWKERVSDNNLEPRPELVRWVVIDGRRQD